MREFVCNAELDANGRAFLGTAPITFIGRSRLLETYISDARTLPIQTPVSFDVVGFPVSEYVADAETRALIAPIRAKELVSLHGIADQSLFVHNVRGPLGKTKVDKDIAASLRHNSLHNFSPLFHNGISILAREFSSENGSITVNHYFGVMNAKV